jgi:transposase
MTEEAPQRTHSLREVFNGLRWLVRAGAPWRMMPNDLPPWEAVYQQTGYDGAKRKRGSKVHMAVDTLGHLLALHVTPANEQDRAQVAQLAAQVQDVTDASVEVAFVDQGYTGNRPRQDAADHGMQLEVVKLPEAKHGFVLLPRRWVVERSFGWVARFRRLARDYERLPGVLAGLHFLAFAILMLTRFVALMVHSA